MNVLPYADVVDSAADYFTNLNQSPFFRRGAVTPGRHMTQINMDAIAQSMGELTKLRPRSVRAK